MDYSYLSSISLPEEEWKEVGNDRHKYLVSSLGRILSCSFKTGGCVVGTKMPALLSFSKDRKGYQNVYISGERFKVHRLVASLFVPNPNGFRYVIHIDGDKWNNSASNLSWADSFSAKSTYPISETFSLCIDPLPGEEWLPVSDTNGTYCVSSFGRVMSKNGFPKILRPKLNRQGYVNIAISANGVRRDVLVHRLVAETFLGNETGKEVNHIDGNRANNRVSNLRWATHSENMNNPNTTIKLKKRISPMRGRLGENNPLSKPIYALLESGERIYFEGSRDALRKGFSYGRVQYCLHHPGSKYQGMTWHFL